MQKALALLFIFLVFLSASSARAIDPSSSEQLLVELSTDVDDHIYQMVINHDPQGNILQGRVDQQIFQAENFQETIQKGMVLSKTHGIDVVVLKSPNFDLLNGGRFELKYMTSPFPRRYRVKYFSLEWESAQEKWILYFLDPNQRKKIPVRKLHIITRKFFGITIGISSVQVQAQIIRH